MHRICANIGAAALVAAVFVTTSPQSALATVVDFDDLIAGSVVAGQSPSGPIVPDGPYAEFSMSCVNGGDGPHSIVVFDSRNPTGGDPDLGTPNQDFGGPGVGWGGGSGRPGANDQDWGHLLIVAENVIDGNGDDLVDEPDDEAGGGVFVFDFEEAVAVLSVVLIDIDQDETAQVRLHGEAGLLATIPAQALGNNSVQTLDCSAHLGVHRMEIELSSSGAVAEFEYVPDTTPVAQATWGSIKAQYTQ